MVDLPTPFEIRTELSADTARLGVVGELDIATAPMLEYEVRSMLARAPARLIIDLRELTFIDSSGLRLFILLSERAAEEGWTLGLIRTSEEALPVFQISGADSRLPFIDEPGPP
jgi:anti-anti-sigma factor